MAVPHRPTRDSLLAALPAARFKRLSPHLEQELIARMIGVHREGVTEAAGHCRTLALLATGAATSRCLTVVDWNGWYANNPVR